LFYIFLQNKAGMVYTGLSGNIAIFALVKEAINVFLMFYKMIQAWFLPSCPGKIADFSLEKGENN